MVCYDGAVVAGETSKGWQVVGPRDFGVHGGGEEVCTVCAKIVLRVPESLGEKMF